MPAPRNPKSPGHRFGRFDPTKPLPLRSFEKTFGIPARTGPTAWTSTSPSVQKLLDHLGRYSQAESSREVYLRILERLCQAKNMTPDDLVKKSKEELEELVQDYSAEVKRQGRSRSYVNGLIKRLKTFLRANGHDNLKIQSYHMPSRYRKTPEYIPTKEEVYSIADSAKTLRDRALILCLWSSGVRVNTFCALNYEDVKDELEKDLKVVMLPVFPGMKQRHPDACKGNIPYHTFFSIEAVEALKIYLRDKEEKYGPIDDDDPLFTTEWNLVNRTDRPKQRTTRMTVSKTIHKCARLAGIKEWQDIHPHTLRKAFKSVLISPTLDGGHMDMATQEFLFGHILPGTQDPYYDRSKKDYHRVEYAKLNFAREAGGPEEVDLVISAVRAASGKDPVKIVNEYVQAKHGTLLPWRQWDIGKQTQLITEAMEALKVQDSTSGEAMAKAQDKVIEVDELEDNLAKGWVFVSNVGTDKCVVRKVQNSI